MTDAHADATPARSTEDQPLLDNLGATASADRREVLTERLVALLSGEDGLVSDERIDGEYSVGLEFEDGTEYFVTVTQA